MKPMSVQGSVRALRSVQVTPGRQRDRRIEELLAEEGDDTILDPRLGGGRDPQKEEEQEEFSLPAEQQTEDEHGSPEGRLKPAWKPDFQIEELIEQTVHFQS